MESNHMMELEIITPDATVFKAPISMLVARATDGEIGILPKHAPLIASLETAPVKVIRDGKEYYIAVFEGFMEVKENVIRILTGQCELPENIDKERAMRAKERAEKRLEERNQDLDVLRAQAALRRALVRLQVAK